MMISILLAAKFSLYTETLWEFKKMGIFYMFIYIADLIGILISYKFYSRFDKKILNIMVSFSTLLLEILISIFAGLWKLNYTIEIPFLSNLLNFSHVKNSLCIYL